jgi:hypothetical protein
VPEQVVTVRVDGRVVLPEVGVGSERWTEHSAQVGTLGAGDHEVSIEAARAGADGRALFLELVELDAVAL